MKTKDIQEIMVQYDEFQDSIRQPLGSILRESNPDPHLYLNLTSPKELEKCLVSLAKVTKDMFLQEVQALEAFPAAYVEPFENHCRFDCEIRNNEGCDELDCLKRWAEYSPNDFLEAIDYACDNGGGDGKGDIMLKEKKPNDLKKFQEETCKNCKYDHWAAVEACVNAWDVAQGCYIEWKRQSVCGADNPVDTRRKERWERNYLMCDADTEQALCQDAVE